MVAGVSLGLLYSTQSGSAMRAVFPSGSLPAIPYLRSALASFSDILVLLALTSLAARRTPSAMLGLAGLGARFWSPLRWSLLIFVPASLVALVIAGWPVAPAPAELIWQVVLGPFTEELVYRGLAIGVLMRLCGWALLPACLWPALFFGMAHLWQGSDLGSIAGVAAITGAGGLLFGWLFVRWGYNLWPAILLHVGLNGLWTVFALGEDAVGGWFGNALRLAVVVAAVATTLRLAPPATVSTSATAELRATDRDAGPLP
jgi:hypothetical protein